MSAPIKKAATLREQVVDALINELRSGRFAPGERLTEQGLAETLGVSRTPIREALNQLMEQGMLQARPRGGYIVPSPTVEQIRQIIAVRMLLEPPAVRMAAVEYRAEEVERITKAIESEAAAARNPHPADFAQANEGFRRAVFDGISNQVLWGLIAQFANHLNFIRAATLRNLKLRREIVERQRQIREAIAVRDEDLAEGLWRSYLRLTEEALVAAMEEIAQTEAGDAEINR
jgi:DNA-binding GntR family transcriptional regulator